MPAFNLSDFLIAVLDLWSTYPLTFLAVAVGAVILAWRCAFRSGIKVVARHEMDDCAPEPKVLERRRLHAIVEITNRKAS